MEKLKKSAFPLAKESIANIVKKKRYKSVRRSALNELITKTGNIKSTRCLTPRGIDIKVPTQSESIKNKYIPKRKLSLRSINKSMENLSPSTPGIMISVSLFSVSPKTGS